MSDEDKAKLAWESLDPETKQMITEVTSGAERGEVTPLEQQAMLGQLYYFIKDDVVEKMMNEDERLKPLLLGVSHLIRTGRQDDDRIRAQMKLRIKRAARLQLLVLNEEVKMDDLALFDGFVNYAYSAIDDQRMGWRGKLAAERVKTYKIEGIGARQKGILERLGFGRTSR